jgi:hypothetical protein
LIAGAEVMRLILSFISGLFLFGCSLPAGVSAVSWAIDGASYITTQKSLTDHGLSFLAGQDCALYRLITNMKVCKNYKDPFFGTIQITDASEFIEKKISQRRANEIFYNFDMSVPVKYALSKNSKKSFQENRINNN